MTKGIIGLPLCLLLLALSSALPGQESPSESKGQPGGDKPPLKKESPPKKKAPAEFKGEARTSVHPYKMHKGDAYRIVVKADGFFPQVRIDGQKGHIPPLDFNPNAPVGPRRDAQFLFLPKETKDYQITVTHAVGTEIGKGPHSYTLTIERAKFTSQATFKDPKLGLGDDSKRMEQGKVYGITVIGRGFAPEVQILDGTRSVLTSTNGRWFGFGPDAEFVSSVTFAPSRTADYRILVGMGPVTDKRSAPPKYTTTIVELKFELSVKDQLTNKDPIYPGRGGRHKVHSVKLQAGKTYQIDMTTTAFDAFLVLEDSAGTVLMQDDFAGTVRRVVYRPTKTDVYRIVATTFAKATPEGFPGPYTVTVVENPHAQPAFAQSPFQNYPKFKK